MSHARGRTVLLGTVLGGLAVAGCTSTSAGARLPISDATAAAPDPGTGNPQWTIAVNLTSNGSQAWADYTGKHNTGGQNPSGSIRISLPP